MPSGLSGYRGGQGHAAHKRVQGHARGGRGPRELASGLFSQGAGGMAGGKTFLAACRGSITGAVVLRRTLRHVMMVVGQEPLEKEH